MHLILYSLARRTVWPGWLRCDHPAPAPRQKLSEQVAGLLKTLHRTRESPSSTKIQPIKHVADPLCVHQPFCSSLLLSSVTGPLSILPPSLLPLSPASSNFTRATTPNSTCCLIPPFHPRHAGAGCDWLRKAGGAWLFPMSCSTA